MAKGNQHSRPAKKRTEPLKPVKPITPYSVSRREMLEAGSEKKGKSGNYSYLERALIQFGIVLAVVVVLFLLALNTPHDRLYHFSNNNNPPVNFVNTPALNTGR